MFNTIAYCLGFSGNGLTPIEEKNPVSFVTKEADDHWTLVDISNNVDGEEENEPMDMLNDRENLLIEHPSMFVSPPVPQEEEPATVNDTNTVTQRHKGAPTTLRRSQRRAARQAGSVISQQNRRNNQFKRTNCDVARRNNKAFQKMRQLVQQPRKRC